MHSPSHLNNYLACNYLSVLDRAAKKGLKKQPYFNDPVAELIRKQGQEHEQRYLSFLKSKHEHVVEIRQGSFEDKVRETIKAMHEGADVIFQAALSDGQWNGFADFLVKTPAPSDLGGYSYHVEDAKLSAEVKGEAVMQLCIYAEMVAEIQGKLPDEIAVVGTERRFPYNPSEFMAYMRYAREKFFESHKLEVEDLIHKLPEPVERCHTCVWRGYCENRWHETDHLKLVAGTTRLHRKELRKQGIDTLEKLAQLNSIPKLERGSKESVEKIFRQAKIQLKGRVEEKPVYEFILPVEERQGLAGLPEPSPGDIWFDIEGDVHIGDQGLEYLFGWISQEVDRVQYHHQWSVNKDQEKDVLERFLKFVLQQREQHPEMHVYHYGHYESSTLRRLTTRYNLLVEEFDDLLRKEVFIDLNRVLKNGLRLSVESYGLKDIEGHYGFERMADLFAASSARKRVTLLLDTASSLSSEIQKIVRDYNEEDCLSTYHLHQWLEERRAELIENGEEVPRFYTDPEEAPTEVENLETLIQLSAQLLEMIPEDHENLNDTEKAIKNLSDLLLWYRREDKSYWWDYFRLKELSAEELMDESKGLAGPFEFVGEIGQIKKSKVYRWKFAPQTFKGEDEDLRNCGTGEEFRISKDKYEIDDENGFFDVTLGAKSQWKIDEVNKVSGFFAFSLIPSTSQIERLMDMAKYVIASGIEGAGAFQLGRNLLLRKQILTEKGIPIRKAGEETLDSAIRLSHELKGGMILPIQGPPGTGKTYTAAHMICELIKTGKKVGITAQSHAVIMNLLRNVNERNQESYGLELNIVKQLRTKESPRAYPEWIRGLHSNSIETDENFDLIGGTAWLWAREGMAEKVDVLFIDEAGQFALADTLSVSHCTDSLVLLGDPQQLESVTKGVHPPEIEVSVLGYWLNGRKVIEPDQGLFLEHTYRMAPLVNTFISEVFYENKLNPIEGLEKQEVIGSNPFNGAGLRYIPCEHDGNQGSSQEEVELIQKLVTSLLDEGNWTNKEGQINKLHPDDIMIVAPYNAQVNELKKALPELRIGTVDKFQGRQAPVVIYSMATSSPEEAPRGMEFLYSLNRLNVAVSRAQCLAILVASPTLFDLSCKTPQQMRLANAYCRFLEVGEIVE